MAKLLPTVLVLAVLGIALPAAAQTQPHQQQPGAKRLEALLSAAEMPFTKSEAGYFAVITVENNESEKFYISTSTIGNDPNDEKLQVIQLYFLLGELPKGTQAPAVLIKRMAEWNANLTFGKVVVIGNSIMYTSSSWLARTDAESLVLDAALGHYASADLRKDVAPYLKP